jgi:hypothetical protein
MIHLTDIVHLGQLFLSFQYDLTGKERKEIDLLD